MATASDIDVNSKVFALLDGAGSDEVTTEESGSVAAEAIAEQSGEAEAAVEVAAPAQKTKARAEVKAPYIPESVLAASRPAPEVEESGEAEEDEVTPPEVANNPKAAHAWQELKAERKRLRDELKAAKDALTTAKSVPPEEVASLKQKLEEYENQIGQYDLTATTAFRKRYDEPINQAIRKGESILMRTGMTKEAAGELLNKLSNPNLTMEQIQDLIADEPMAIQGVLVTMNAEVAELSQQRQAALDSWRETRAAQQEQESRNLEIQLAQDIERGAQVALDQAVKEGNWMLSRTDNPDWNRDVDHRINTVKGIIRSARPEELIKWVMEGVTAKPLREMLLQTHALAEQRKAELEGVVRGGPKLGSSGQPAPAAPKGKVVSIEQRVNEILGG